MRSTPENQQDGADVDAPKKRDVVERLREHFAGWDDPENETMPESRFEELADLTPEHRAEQATAKELAEFEELSTAYSRFGAGLASVYGKSALTGFGSSLINRALTQSTALDNIGANLSRSALTSLGLTSNALGLNAITQGIVGKSLITPDFASALKALTSPAVQFSNPITELFATSALATSNLDGLTKLVNPSVFQSSGLQHLVTGVSAPTIANVLATNSPLISAIEGITRQWWADEPLEDHDADLQASEPPPSLPDEQSMEEAWQDIERVLRADKQLRRSVTSGAKRLSRQAQIGRKPAARILMLMILIWLCAVSVPWTDGERKLDDIAVPVGLLAAEYLAYLKVDSSNKKNPLQKNGPRRRRHRRKRKK